MPEKIIYISCSENDLKHAKWLGRILETNGFTVLLPNYSNYKIENATSAIDSSDAVLVLCSSNMKKIDYQSKETDYAFNQGKKLIAIITEKCEIEDQYNYYLSQSKRFELYKTGAKKMQLLIAEINKAVASTDNTYTKHKMSAYHLDLLSEEDIDCILTSEDNKIKFPEILSPFSRLYSRNPIVKFALKCHTWLLSIFFGFFLVPLVTGSILDIFFELNSNKVYDFQRLAATVLFFLLWLLTWNLSYIFSILIAKLRVKNKFAIVCLTILSVIFMINMIGTVGDIIYG